MTEWILISSGGQEQALLPFGITVIHDTDMEADERIEQAQKARGKLWEARINEAHRSGRLYEWVSSFHPHRLPCRLAGPDLLYGSYNAGLKVIFDDGTIWLLRLPRVGKVHDGYADEKVAMEVAAINLIRKETTIPVPTIQAWGTSAQNPLALGPYIIMDFIQGGVCLNDLLKGSKGGTRLLREDLSDIEMETIYRQFAVFLLQLFKLNFDHIGSLDPPTPELSFPIRPLTWKAHDILQTGGVDTFGMICHPSSQVSSHRQLGDRRSGFSSTVEYFQYLVEQDLEQLDRQPNSVYGRFDAMAKYRSFQVLRSLIPDFIHQGYDRSNFKIICDDLGLANLIVRSRQDLTVIGVVDLEWSYIGPAQLFGSVPWWLLMDRPINPAWDCDNGEPRDITDRFFRCAGIFQRVLEEEEAKMPGHEDKELSRLVRWSESSGAMWVHMLLSNGFNDPRTFPFTKLIQHLGVDEWERRRREVSDDDATAFGSKKVMQLDQYNRDLEEMDEVQLFADGNATSKNGSGCS